MLRSTLKMWLVVMLVVAGVQHLSGQTVAADPATQKTVQDLKLQALEARRQNDAAKERALYDQILRLNPDDATARQELYRIEAELKQKAENETRRRLALNDSLAKEALARSLNSKAETAVADAKRLGTAAPLDAARSYLDDARRVLGRPTPEITRVERLIGLESDLQRTRWWELWGGVGSIFLAGLVTLVIVIWRRGGALEMIAGPETGQTFKLAKATTAVGALTGEVDWVITDSMRKISRHHFDIVRNGRHYFIVDRSTNGTRLNGERVPPGEPVLLRHGDEIGVSDEVVLRFR